MYPLRRLRHIQLPESYSLSGHSLQVKDPNGRICIDFLPKNRTFSNYDSIFYGLLSKHFELHPGLAVLDIGGGYKSVAVQEMMDKFPSLKAINIDLFAENTSFSKQRNASSLPIGDSSIDVVVSVDCITRFLISLPSEGKIMAQEMERVLKPDSLAFVWPGFDLTPMSKGIEAVVQLYGKNTYGLVYKKTHTPYQS